MGRLPLFRLLRIAGVSTALADVLAGYLILRFYGAGPGDLRALPYLLGASACLYLAGMACNDVCDARADARQRPERPIPSGQLSLTVSALLAAVLFVAGLLLAMSAGYNCFLVASLLIVSILAYNTLCKHNEVCGPLAMGACRGLNLVLGLSAHPDLLLYLSYPLIHTPPLLLGAYTACVTVLARCEAGAHGGGGPRRPAGGAETVPDAGGDEQESRTDSAMETQAMSLEPEHVLPPLPAAKARLQERLPLALVAPASGVLLFVPLAAAWILPRTHLGLLVFGVLVLALGLAAYPVLTLRTPLAVRALVGRALTGMVLLDAGLVACLVPAGRWRLPHLPLVPPTLDGLAGVALVASMLFPVLIFKRRIEIT